MVNIEMDMFFFACSIFGIQLQKDKTHQTSVMDMTLNNQIVMLQECRGFCKCGVRFHCHCSQIHSGQEW